MCLPFTVFQTPMACKRPLCTRQCLIPRSPAVSIASFEEDSYGEAGPFPTPSSEWDETPLIFTVRQEINKRAREAPKQAWSSLVLEQQMAGRPSPFCSVNPLHLEAAGTHIKRHARPQNQPSHNSKADSVSPGKYHFVFPNSFFSLFSWSHFVFNFNMNSKVIDSMTGPILEGSIRTISVSA